MVPRLLRTPALAFSAALLLAAGAAHAQLFRAYVSPAGLDTNNCTLAAPCRLLPAALGAVADGGEIWMLDSANYNTATVAITKSVTILAIPGAVGSVVATGGPALAVSGTALVVALRNLVVVPLPGAGGTEGLTSTATNSRISVEECQFANLPSDAILASGVGTRLFVRNTTMRHVSAGLHVRGGVDAMASGVRVFDVIGTLSSNAAFWTDNSVAGTTTSLTIEESAAYGGFVGFLVYDNNVGSPGTARMFVTRSTASANAAGALLQTSEATSRLDLGSSMIVNNNSGVVIVGSGLRSLGDNLISGNVANGDPGALPASPR